MLLVMLADPWIWRLVLEHHWAYIPLEIQQVMVMLAGPQIW
jgi:hypothetical protein